MSIHIAVNPRDRKAVGLAYKGEPEAAQHGGVTIPIRRGALWMIAAAITLGVTLPIISIFAGSPKPTSGHGVTPNVQLAKAVAPFIHELEGSVMFLGPLVIVLGVCALAMGALTGGISIPTPSIGGSQGRREFRRFVAAGRLTEVHPEILKGATTWARSNHFQLLAGSPTEASLARSMHAAEAADRREVLSDMIARRAAVLEAGTVTQADLDYLDEVGKLFERLSQISTGDQAPMHIQELMALYPAIIRMLAPDVELLGIDGIPEAQKARIREDLRAWGAKIARMEKELRDEHLTDEAIRTELATALAEQVRALIPAAD